jgi:hypothetical protein
MCWRRGDRCGIEPTVKGQRSPSLSPPTAGCRTLLLAPRSPACASGATPSELVGPARCEDRAPEGEFEAWGAAAKETPGSWWPDWAQWITAQAPAKVPAHKPGDGKLKPLEDAPGSYVRVKA